MVKRVTDKASAIARAIALTRFDELRGPLLFSVDSVLKDALDSSLISTPLREQFEAHEIPLSLAITVQRKSTEKEEGWWLITDSEYAKTYTVHESDRQLFIYSGVTSVELVTVREDKTPFLWQDIIGRQAWQVEFDGVGLRLKSAIPGFQDQYSRTFFVFIDESTGQLLSIQSVFDGKDPDMRPQPSGATAEAQLRAEEEIYHKHPEDDPKVLFLDALDTVLSKGIGSPFFAKEIHGVYVMHSRMGSRPRSVWAITLRGLPPISAHGRYADSIPVWQRNHMRNVVDATTGENLFATNSPQPD
ncbi:MAG: hypothetical protein JW883_17045 [Deltaproteobacteria bacterium]|nr:hypothetical protein [Deltaproteobacteria bacterium]